MTEEKEKWPEVELALVGSILLDPRSLLAVRSIVGPEHFRSSHAAKAFRASCRLWDRGAGIDPVVLRAYLGSSPDTTEFLLEAADAVPTAGHAAEYAEAIRLLADRASLNSGLREILDATKARPLHSSTAEAVDDVLKLEADAYRKGGSESFADEIRSAFDDYERPTARLAWGSGGLDRIMQGTEPGSLTTIAARPGGGKTHFTLDLVRKFAAASGPVEFLSLEMPKDQIVPLLLCGHAGIHSMAWRLRRIRDEEFGKLLESVDTLQALPIALGYETKMTAKGFRSWAHRAAIKGARLIVLDYLQLVTSTEKGLPRNEQIAQATRTIKLTMNSLASRGFNIRAVICSQLNREIEKEKKRKPTFADLKESGSIEQDSDNVIFLHVASSNPTDAVVDLEVIVAKHRSGGTGTATYRWDKSTGVFGDLFGGFKT